MRLKLGDAAVPLDQLLLVRFRDNAAFCSGVSGRLFGVLALRFLLVRLLLRRLDFLLLLDLLRLRAILLTVHVLVLSTHGHE